MFLKNLIRGVILTLYVFVGNTLQIDAQTIVSTNDTSICLGSSITLHAELVGGSYGTSSYSFESIPYAPEPFSGGNPVTFGGNQDDQIAGPFNIGFNFCFFNNTYTQFYIGSNGWIGFTYNAQWISYNPDPLPNNDYDTPQNCIFAPWLDWWPNLTTTNVYYYITGSSPNQKLVVYWKDCPMFNNACRNNPSTFGTFQIVINETTSVIENNIEFKTTCGMEVATQGVQNLGGTVAFIAPGRNQTVWNATNESTRFVPSGISWYTGGYPLGTLVGNGADFTVSPAVTTTYTIVIETCAGGGAITKEVTVSVDPPPVADAGPPLSFCSSGVGMNVNGTATNASSILWTTSGTGNFFDATVEDPVYFPSANDLLIGSVDLTMTVTGMGGCSSQFDSEVQTFVVEQSPFGNAGLDNSVCENNTVNFSGSITGNGTPEWLSLGDGLFSDRFNLNTVYTPGANDIVNGSAAIVMICHGQGACLGTTNYDTLNLQIVRAPIAHAGVDFDHCSNTQLFLTGTSASNFSSISWSTSGTGTFDDQFIINPEYQFSANDLLNGSVYLILTANPNAPCTARIDSVLVTFVLPPVSNAGVPKVMCANSTLSLADATAANSSSVLWSSSGSAGTLSSTTALNPVYTPSAADTAAHGVTLQLIAYGNGPCNPDTSWVTITINPEPAAFAGIDSRICETSTLPVATSSARGAQSLSWSSTGTGTFNNSNILHPVYSPSAADIAAGVVTLNLNVTAFPQCTNQSDAALLRITRQPVATAGGNNQICQNTSFTVSAATSLYDSLLQWNHNGTGTLSGATTLTPTYTPGAGEAATVTLTMNVTPRVPCAALAPSMQLRIDPLPTATINPATGQICEGNPYVFAPGVASATANSVPSWTETGAGVLSNANTFTPTYTPAGGETGPVDMTMTVNGLLQCASETATAIFRLTLDPEPTADAGPNATICAGDNHQLNGNATFYRLLLWTTSGTGGFNNANVLNPIYTPSAADTAAGSVTLTLAAYGIGTCFDSITYDSMILTMDRAPVANAGPDASYCVNGPITLGGAYAWNNTGYWWTRAAVNDGTFNPNPPVNTLTPDYMPGNIDLFSGTVTLTLHVQGRMACASRTVTDNRVFTVSPYPTVDAGADDYICSNVTQYTFSGLGNNYNNGTILWTFSGGDGVLTNANTMTPTYFAGPIDLSTVDRSIDFYLRLQGVGVCNGTFVTDTVNLLIDPTPISSAGPDDFVCGQRPYPLAANAQYENTIRWRTTGTGTFSDSTILNPTYTPSAADVGNNVQLQLWLWGCQGLDNADFMVLTVHPDPSATMSGTASICEGGSTPISIALTGLPPWSITYTNGVAPVTVNNIMASPYVFNVSPAVNTTWWITSGSDANCTIPTDSIHGVAAITVNAIPDQFLITVTNGGIFCEGDVGVDLGLSGSQLGMQYELYRNGAFTGNMLPGTGGPLNYGTYDMPAQYYVRALNPVGNCEAFMNDTVVIIMNPTPVTDFISSVSCMGDSTCFMPFGAYIDNVSSWTWSFGDGQFFTSNAPMDTVCHMYNTWGTFMATLFVTDTNNCSYSISHPVIVLPLPVAFFRYNTPSCSGEETYFEDLSSTDTGYIQTWVWTWGDGSAAETFVFPNSPNTTHLYPGAGTYTVNLHITTNLGCEDDYSFDVTISEKPVADFSYDADCAGLITQFFDESLENGGGQIVEWHWNFGDPASGANNVSTLSDPVHVYNTPGTYTVELVVVNLNGCSDTITQNNIVIAAPPTVDFTFTTACLNSPTQFTSVVNAAQTGSYYWQFGDNSTSNDPNPAHVYTAPGTYTVTLTVTNLAGCEASISHTVEINPLPHAQFSATAEHCLGDVVQFDDLSSVQGDYIVSWTWRFGDGSSQTLNHPSAGDVSHTYQSAASFQVWLKVTDSHGCVDSTSMIINVHEQPLADFSMQGQCAGSEIQFINESLITGTSVITQYDWNFGDPASGTSNISTLEDPVHAYNTPGTYTITLTVTTNYGCSHDTAFDIDILDLPEVSFTASNACAGNAAQFIADAEAGAIQTYNWDFGDGNTGTGATTSHVYNYTGTYLVTLTVTDTSNCQNSYQTNVVIYPSPDALFSFSTPGCQGDTVVFTDGSTLGGGGYIARWTWDFGDGTTANYLYPNAPATISHIYSQSGTFNITLTVKTNDSCTSQITRSLVVHEKPQAMFTFGTACEDMQVSFTDMSSYSGGSISAWEWDFGDPPSGTSNNSTLQNPTHIYNNAGSYIVSLIAYIAEGCSDTAQMSVTVHAPPAVGFSIQESCSNDTTFFVSSDSVQMGAIESWAWDFGDNTTSTLADPMHIYTNAGVYTVILTVTDTSGCSSTRIKPVTVWPGPVADFAVSGAGCAGAEVTFNDMSQANGGNIILWEWDFGDGHDTTLTAPVAELYHTYSQPGTFQVTLTVHTQMGCSSQQQRIVNVSVSPQAAFTWSNTCQGNATQFTDQTSLNGGSGITARFWDFGDPSSGTSNTSTQQNPTHVFTDTGSYTVQLVSINASGCADTIVNTILITEVPGVDFYTGNILCEQSAVQFFIDNAVTPTAIIEIYNWDFGDGSAGSNEANAQHTYDHAGIYTVELMVIDSNGCSNIRSRQVEIHHGSLTQFSSAQYCMQSPTLFTDYSQAPQGDTIVAWHWDFGVGASQADTSIVQNPQYIYTQAGTYAVTLTTTTEHGCSSTQTLPVQIWNLPTALFSYSVTPCSNGEVQFMDNSASYQANITGWNWEFEPFRYSYEKNPRHIYYELDSCYDVSLQVTDNRGCIEDTIMQVCVPAAFEVTFSTTASCFGQPVGFTPVLTAPAGDSLITLSWNFGDPASGSANTSQQREPEHTFTAAGHYTVRMDATDIYGCSYTEYLPLQVHALPQASFIYAAGICDSTINFASNSLDTAGAVAMYIWSYGDGTTDTIYAPDSTAVHKYMQTGTYTVNLHIVDINGCESQYSDTIERNACIVAEYVHSDTVCQNNAISFTDMSTCNQPIERWEWNWDDGSAPEVYDTLQGTLWHTFAQAGTFNVTLTVSTTMATQTVSDAVTYSVTVLPGPLAGFMGGSLCLGLENEFADTTHANGSIELYYNWDFGDTAMAEDTSTLRSPGWLYTSPGIYNPQLVVSNERGCTDTATLQVQVYSLPEANWDNLISCNGHPTQFIDLSIPVAEDIPVTQWNWAISDSLGERVAELTGDTATWTFDMTGRYSVFLTISDTNSCVDTLTKDMRVYPAPVAAIDYTENREEQGILQFSNGTLGAETWEWDFGNGFGSLEFEPQTKYEDDGTYTIIMTAHAANGCMDTVTMVYDMLYKALWVPNAFTPQGEVPGVSVWKPVGVNLLSYHVEVFDRHGVKMWESTKLDATGNPSEGWYGTYQDKRCIQGVYVWRIKATFRDGTEWENNDAGLRDNLYDVPHGTILLIR